MQNENNDQNEDKLRYIFYQSQKPFKFKPQCIDILISVIVRSITGFWTRALTLNRKIILLRKCKVFDFFTDRFSNKTFCSKRNSAVHSNSNNTINRFQKKQIQFAFNWQLSQPFTIKLILY